MRVAIIGGGLAGLSLSILLRRRNYDVTLYEQRKIVRHRVCGEYISRESDNFLKNLGLDYEELGAPIINRFTITSAGGVHINRPLRMGARGLSRFTLESELLRLADKAGVIIRENEKVEDIARVKPVWQLRSSHGEAEFDQVVGAWGKRSNLDKLMDRPFYTDQSDLSGFLGVKYHVQTDHNKNSIELHNFPGGYCGFSAVEDDKFCLCYLVNKKSVNACNNCIEQLEDQILGKNKALKQILHESVKLYDKPLVISNVSFAKKATSQFGFPVIGDAAGLIAPLSGNGMSIAFHSAKLLDSLLGEGLHDDFLLTAYKSHWTKRFNWRFTTGRMIQKFLGKGGATETFLKAIEPFPKLADQIIQQTHGKTF